MFGFLFKKKDLEILKKENDSDYGVFSVNPIQWDGDGKESIPPQSPLWDFKSLNVPYLWSHYGVRGQNTHVAIIDSGIDLTHQNLYGKSIRTRSFVPNEPDVKDGTGHGTWVAGKIGGLGVGIAPLCKLTCLKVLDQYGAGSSKLSTEALTWLSSKNDVDVINMSLRGIKKSNDQEKAIWDLYKKGVLIVAASGNQNSGEAFYPASYDGLLAVGAYDIKNERASFSNFGAHLDITAPGVSCYSLYLNKSFRAMRGTSMATPVVSGIIALGISLIKKKSKTIKGPELRDLIWETLLTSVDDLGPEGKDEWYGCGGINGVRFISSLYEKLK